MIKIDKTHFKNTFSVLRLLPNFLTLISLTIGLNSFRMAISGKWEAAVGCIIIAAIFDSLDGKIARLLNATSNFGAELDSLCDFVNFGICPVFILYLWLYPILPLSFLWSSVVIYAICMAIRLARFNTNLADSSKISKLFFIGVPAPVGSMLVLMPLILNLELFEGFLLDGYKIFIPFYIIAIGCLLASRLPTFSLKHIQIRREYVWFVMLIFSVAALELLLHPWHTLPFLSLIYLLSIPFSYRKARKIQEEAE